MQRTGEEKNHGQWLGAVNIRVYCVQKNNRSSSHHHHPHRTKECPRHQLRKPKERQRHHMWAKRWSCLKKIGKGLVTELLTEASSTDAEVTEAAEVDGAAQVVGVHSDGRSERDSEAPSGEQQLV